MSRTIEIRPDANRRIEALTDSERYDLLANERRRTVLAVLDRETTPVTLETMAGEVADCESVADAPDTGAVRSVQVSLHHVHLPKMAQLGVLTYDTTGQRIES